MRVYWTVSEQGLPLKAGFISHRCLMKARKSRRPTTNVVQIYLPTSVPLPCRSALHNSSRELRAGFSFVVSFQVS